MLVVTIELWPYGDKTRAKEIGRAHIANDGTGSLARGNYNITLFSRNNRHWRTGRVEDFPRKRLTGWDLLCRGLTTILGDRNFPKSVNRNQTPPCYSSGETSE